MAVRTVMDDVLGQAVDAGQVPGVVALAADEHGETYAGAFGSREAGGDVAMSLDTVFAIASMTKAITSVAAMQQVERGTLELDAPISAVLPQLSNPLILTGFDGAGVPRLRPATRQITLRHLLTHTSGFTYENWNADLARYTAYAGLPQMIACRDEALAKPLVFEPGERWEYSIGIDWAGKAVEAVSGQRLEEYFAENIFGPLGMTDTNFILRPDQRERRVSMHRRTGDTSFEVFAFEIPQQPALYMGGGGLYSVGRDYLTFLRMLMHGGSLNGAQVLKPETVAEINRNQIGELRVRPMISANPRASNDAEFFPGLPKTWGLAYLRNEEPTPTGRSAGSLAWAGISNTYYWLDPTTRVAGVLLTQIQPFADPLVLELFGRFERAVYGLEA
ncbi:MAG: beta-lactamase family protein [Chloroflexi bacterium]|nr:beta-lactamase family protein [Chloroflexota bacterium]